MTAVDSSPCLNCGACCASFRVSFYWAEAEVLGMPASLSEPVNSGYACMRGTSAASPRCAALLGDIGATTRCTIYAQRPSPCREVQAGDSQCQKARRRHGLPPLEIADDRHIAAHDNNDSGSAA